ncbi:unnamed protein product [Caenorhabditis brenneri]
MAVISLPIFRIPFLALCIILGRFGPYEIIQLSLCSKRSLRVAKQCWKNKGEVKATLSANMATNIDIHFDYAGHLYRFVILDEKCFYDQQIHSVRDLFDVPIHSIDLEEEARPNDFIRVIDSIMSVQESIEKCTLHGENSNDECLTHLLDNCKVTRTLKIYGGPTRQFSYNWNIRLDRLHMFNGSSITLQNLMNMNCKFLELTSSSLTSEDANQFLKHWQNGGNSRLKFLSTEIKAIDREVITSGFDIVLQPRGVFRYYKGKYNFIMFRSGGVDLRRIDGTIGTIFFYDNAFEFGVDPTEDML